jgi:ribonucleoside-diphosphate reductase alpha chain
MGGRYVPSLLAAIGNVIEQHLIEIGFILKPERPQLGADLKKALAAPSGIAAEDSASTGTGSLDRTPDPRLRPCPRCGAAALARIEGCDTCFECGYSRCV